MNLTTLLFHEAVKIVSGLSPRTPSTSVPRYVSMKNFSRMAIMVQVANGETVTGSAITLKQATTVAGASEKALGFSYVWKNLDTEDVSGGDVLTQVAVVANTFTTDTVDDKSSLYVIEIDSSQLDLTNRFDCVRLGTGDGVATVVGALYILFPVTGSPAPVALTN